jgi:hypothetical protein
MTSDKLGEDGFPLSFPIFDRLFVALFYNNFCRAFGHSFCYVDSGSN